MTPAQQSQWHEWFAWYPVEDTRTDESIWLETCQRRMATHRVHNEQGSALMSYWVYSKITGGGQMMPVT